MQGGGHNAKSTLISKGRFRPFWPYPLFVYSRMNDHARPLPVAPLRYARAFYDLAASRGALEQVEADLGALRSMIKESAELRRMLESPLLRRPILSRAVNALAVQAKFGALATQFLRVVVGNGRARDIPVILEAFFSILAQARGEVVAEVTAARALSAAQTGAIANALQQGMAGKGVKKVIVTTRIDASVLGGVRVQIGSNLYDGTLKGKLQRLAQLLQDRKAA